MGLRARRIVGISAMTVFVLVYIAVTMVIGATRFIDAAPLVQLAYFAGAGLAWTIPAAFIIKWMRSTPEQTGL